MRPATLRSRTVLGVLLASCFGASAQTADPVAPFLGTWSGVLGLSVEVEARLDQPTRGLRHLVGLPRPMRPRTLRSTRC